MNRKSIFVIGLFLGIVLLTERAFAITDEEIFRNLLFSFQNPGARSSAMGGAFIGLADDATAAEANPAGLTILTRPEVSLEYRHTEYDAAQLNSISNVSVPDTAIDIATANIIKTQDRPSFLSVVFPAHNWSFAFSRQEAVKQEVALGEAIRLQNPSTGATLLVTSGGATSQEIVNYNFSVAAKISKSLSLGATVRYTKLNWQAFVTNDIIDPVQINFSQTSFDDNDSGVSFNVGGLYKSSHLSLGAVYKRNAKLQVTERETSEIFHLNRSFPNVLKVPDTFGAGVAIKPNDSLTISADVQRILYSDLTQDFEPGHNPFTFGFTSNDLQFKVDDKTEFHVGTEFVVFAGSVPVALRIGYYNKPSNSLVLESAGGKTTPTDRAILPQIFTTRPDFNHFTFGNGFVFGSHFQVDWAGDFSKLDTTFVLSTVLRF